MDLLIHSYGCSLVALLTGFLSVMKLYGFHLFIYCTEFCCINTIE